MNPYLLPMSNLYAQINRAYRALMRRPPTSQPHPRNTSVPKMSRSVSIVTDNTAPNRSTDTLVSIFSAGGAASVESSTTAPPSPEGSSQTLPGKGLNNPFFSRQASSSTEAHVDTEEWISVEPEHAAVKEPSRKSKAPNSRAFYAHDQYVIKLVQEHALNDGFAGHRKRQRRLQPTSQIRRVSLPLCGRS